MQSRWIAIVFVAAGMAYGQTPCAGGAPPKNDPGCVSAVQYATCPKYQHIEKSTLRCPHAGQGLPKDVCEWSSDAREFCADDVHVVTEVEWQELLARLKALEHPTITQIYPVKPKKAITITFSARSQDWGTGWDCPDCAEAKP